MEYEIYDGQNVIKHLPFVRFCGYQIINDKILFIDCLGSRITEYGEVCYFDFKTKQIIYTKIYSGGSFYLTSDSKFLIVSSLMKSKNKSDIEDVFGLESDSKEYPLNVSVYDFNMLTKLQNIDLEDKIQERQFENLYLNFVPLENEKIRIEYHIIDTLEKIECGILDLSDMNFF